VRWSWGTRNGATSRRCGRFAVARSRGPPAAVDRARGTPGRKRLTVHPAFATPMAGSNATKRLAASSAPAPVRGERQDHGHLPGLRRGPDRAAETGRRGQAGEHAMNKLLNYCQKSGVRPRASISSTNDLSLWLFQIAISPRVLPRSAIISGLWTPPSFAGWTKSRRAWYAIRSAA
jgi:hypothetical protein